MHIIDYVIFVVYMLAMLGVGLYFFNKNKTAEDFYVSGRNMSSWHIALTIMAASRNIVTDIIAKFSKKELTHKKELRLSQIITLLVGIFAILLASQMQNVLELMLYSYALMVSGLFIPVLGALFWKKSHPKAAFWSMLFGGATTILLIITENKLPLGIKLPEHLDANIYGISISLLLFVTISLYHNNKQENQNGIQNN